MMAKYTATYIQVLRCHSRERVIQCSIRTGRYVRNRCLSSDSRALPKIAQPSVWQSIIPRALRSRSETPSESKGRRAPNLASYFIWIYLLIGSQAIRLIQLQNEFKTFMRRAELKIGKLREVVEALQKGEEIDVEKALGTGDETQEREWEEALREIENEDRVWQTSRQRRREEKARAREEAAREANIDTASPVNEVVGRGVSVEEGALPAHNGRPKVPGFY